MSQAEPSILLVEVDERLDQIEEKLDQIEPLMNDLLLEYRKARVKRLSTTLHEGTEGKHWLTATGTKLYVLLGGVAALIGGVVALPSDNPARQVVDYSVTALLERMPDPQLPDLHDLGPLTIGVPDGSQQPFHPLAPIKQLKPSPGPETAPSRPVAATSSSATPEIATSSSAAPAPPATGPVNAPAPFADSPVTDPPVAAPASDPAPVADSAPAPTSTPPTAGAASSSPSSPSTLGGAASSSAVTTAVDPLPIPTTPISFSPVAVPSPTVAPSPTPDPLPTPSP